MENTIEKLIANTYSVDENTVLKSIEHLGLLTERHLQNRYGEEDYFYLLDKNDVLYNLKLCDSDIDSILQTVFYHLVNSNSHPVAFAWCLGKFYQKDLLLGFTRLLVIYQNEDDVVLQLLMSLNATYDFQIIGNAICSEFKRLDFRDLPKSRKFLTELSEVFPVIKECLV